MPCQAKGQEEDPQCCVCHCILHLSAVQCTSSKCDRARLACLHHADQLCECQARRHQLLFRHTCAELDDAVFKAKEMAAR